MRLGMLSLALLALAGCETPTVEKPAYLIGRWGGPHAAVAFNYAAEVQFDCASGSIDARARAVSADRAPCQRAARRRRRAAGPLGGVRQPRR